MSDSLRVGIHLPQFGRAMVTGGVQRAARRAEELGFADVWVSDHLVIPVGQPYPAPYLYDPLQALAFAGAVTDTIGLGTSVLIGPQYTSPLALANTLASLDHLSGGRLTLGIGIGWSEKEYEALHAPFDHRGERLDEMLDLFRTAWSDDPATHRGKYYAFSDIRIFPKPLREVPVWVGGASDAALARALERGNGYHGIGVSAEDSGALVEQIRATRPEDDFTISMRVTWDGNELSAEEIASQYAAYADVGMQHLVVAPDRGDIDAWITGMENIADAVGLTPR